MPLEKVQTKILDDANKMLWMAADWRWSVGTLTAITITSNTQDYTLAPPADFLFLLHSYVTDGASVTRHLVVVPSLPASVVVKGSPAFISYQGSNNFRISPNPGTQITPVKQIVSFYKKKSPVITASNQMTGGTLVMDDDWFWVYQAGVLYSAYMWADDQRAGSCNIDSQGRAQYTGQRAVFESGVQMMRLREPLPVFQTNVTPDTKEMT